MTVKPHHLVTRIVAGIFAILLLVHMVGIVRRDVEYHAIVRTYSRVLKPGMTGSEVENYFVLSKYVSFTRAASEDIVEIAHEKAGWFCQEQLVYLRFEFDGAQPNEPRPMDILVRTSLKRSLCLDLP